MDVLSFPNSVRQSFDGSDSHLLVKGLPPRIDECSLYEIFSKFGEIQSCRLVPTSSPTNQAVVNLSSPLQAKEAISALHGAPTDRGVLEVVAGSAGASKLPDPSNLLVCKKGFLMSFSDAIGFIRHALSVLAVLHRISCCYLCSR